MRCQQRLYLSKVSGCQLRHAHSSKTKKIAEKVVDLLMLTGHNTTTSVSFQSHLFDMTASDFCVIYFQRIILFIVMLRQTLNLTYVKYSFGIVCMR
jgi:hypothetical protein